MVLRVTPGPQLVTVVIVTYNSEQYLRPVLTALLSDPGRPEQVVVVDNGSSDGTKSILRAFDLNLVEAPENLGFAAACHLGVTRSTQPVIALLGHDTIPKQGWLPPLIAVLSDDSIGAAMPTIEDAAKPGRFNTSGGHLTYFGLGWLSGAGDVVDDGDEVIDVAYPSGAAMVMRRTVWDQFGGFRPEFFMYHEDSDLGWRLRMAGLRVVRVARSVVHHHYEFGRNPNKMFWLERNRLLMILSNYRRRTLVVLSPALLAVEMGVTWMALRDRWMEQKIRAWGTVWRQRRLIKSGRSLAQRNRKIGDADLLSQLEHQVSTASQVAVPGGALIVGRLLGAYRDLVLPLVRLLDRFG